MLKILAVDDSPIVTKIFERFFTAKNYPIETTNTSFGVSNRIRQFNPDVLLMDLDMPGLCGFNLLKLLNEAGTLNKVRTIVVSSNEERMRETVMKGYAHGYHVKGQPLERLEALIMTTAPELSNVM
jgi:CheY-like chemotaxis protein